MPMLADLDDPPRPRWRGLLVGVVVALPLAGVLVGVLMPSFVSALLGGAQRYDERLRMEAAYMQAVCTQMELPRDESLCECVLAGEYPAIDCQGPFLAWSVARQQDHCAVAENNSASLSFCACVNEVGKRMGEAEDEDGSERAAQAYRNCQELPDAVYLPTIEELGEELGEVSGELGASK